MKIIAVDDYGCKVNSGDNCIPAVICALNEASKSKIPCTIRFLEGRYDFFIEHATRKELYISNTASEDENWDITKTIGICIDTMKNVTLEGNDTLIMCHGKMTSIAVLNSKNILIKGLSIDYTHPTVTEMTVTASGEGYIICKVHPDSQYKILNGAITWYGDNFSFSKGISQIFDPESGKTWREYGPMEDENLSWLELSPGLLRLDFKTENLISNENPYNIKIGQTFQMRNPIRDQVGIFINESTDLCLDNITMHFMHGLGIISQHSKNICIRNIMCIPSNERTCASFSDFVHFSGCSGLIEIYNSKFIGSHDDAINVHGTHLKIVQVSKNSISLRFMHPQTYGIGGFSIGDAVEAISKSTLRPVGSGIVQDVKYLSPYEIVIILEDTMRGQFPIGDVVENITRTPDVIIRNNHFERMPTRGILITTRGKVIISDNVFNGTIMSGFLIADDAKSWFESGNVNDVLLEKNTFIDCGEPVIYIEPENEVVEINLPVHHNIRILNNVFASAKKSVVLSAKSVEGLWFCGNAIQGGYDASSIIAKCCSDIHIESNV